MTAVLSYNGQMADGFDIEVLRSNLSAIMKRKGIKPTTLSLQTGKSPSLVADLLTKTADTKISTVFKLADKLGVSASDLLFGGVEEVPIGPRLFVKGEVAAGQWVDAYEWPRDDWQPLTGRPDITASLDQRFFLRVAGDSMDEVYPHGTFVECVSLFGKAEATPGKRVVVVRERDDGMVEATVKELVEIDSEFWFVPRSSNPSHQSFKAAEPSDGICEVRIVAVIVASVRPE